MVMISVSCIREEAPNAEADILSCTVDGDILKAEPEIDNESAIDREKVTPILQT